MARLGRRPKVNKEPLTVTGISLSMALCQEARQWAADHDMTFSALVRRLLTRHLAEVRTLGDQRAIRMR